MGPEILGTEWFPRSDQEQAALYQLHVVGTKHSNWGLLARAARSSLTTGLKQAADLLNYWARLCGKGQHPGETRFLLVEMYYQRVLGSLLGAVSGSTFALESFLRLSAELRSESCCSSPFRLEKSLKKFDKLSFLKRARRVVALWEAKPLPDELEQRLRALIDFRNDLAHDSPVEFLNSGLAQRRKRGKRQIHLPGLNYGGRYPTLYDHNMPLSPAHALLAGQTHDGFVAHARTGDNEALAEALDCVISRMALPIAQFDGLRGDVQPVIRDWDKRLLPWVDSVSQEDREDFYRRLVRRVNLKRI